MNALCAGRVKFQPKSFFRAPSTFWPNGPRDKSAAAGRTHIFQNCVYACSAIGALIGANTRLIAVMRKIAVAQLTIWPKFKHGISN